MKHIVVIGSVNMDIVLEVDQFPQPGETVKGNHVSYKPGGKGANQAVAASLAGASVSMAGAVGTDGFGSVLRETLSLKGVETSHIRSKEGGSGLAFITVSCSGENQIILSPGANGLFSPSDIPDELLRKAGLLLLQNEIPWETNEAVLEKAALFQVPVFLNPAPALRLPAGCLPFIHTLILNESEAEAVTGRTVTSREQAMEAAQSLRQLGVRNVLVTLGKQGSILLAEDGAVYETAAFLVQAVDTTAAGDTFIGAYAARMTGGSPVGEALRFASAAAALSVTRLGAQESIPTEREVIDFLRDMV